MKFLVILIALTINYLWLRDIDRFDDAWFFRFRARSERFARGFKADSSQWLLANLIVYALPLVMLGLLLAFLGDWFLGIPLMLVHILVLLVVFDRTQPGKLASEFLKFWRAGDMQSCARFVTDKMGTPADAASLSGETLLLYFRRQLIYRCFEKMFVVFFWYMLTGPLGVLFCYISYQLRDSQDAEHTAAEVDSNRRVLMLLEWIPLRLLAITFSLAGNFVRCFERLKNSFWSFDRDVETAELLHGYASCALSGINSHGDEDEWQEDTSDAADRERLQKAREVETLLGLLERSQAIWLTLLAIITIFGLQAT